MSINTLHKGDDDDDDNNNNEGPPQNPSDNTEATHRESKKSSNYRKQPHWALNTQTAESANVKVQNIFHVRNNITCGTNCKYRTAATLYTL